MGILNWIRKQWGSTPTETVTEVVVETTKVEEPVEVVEVKEETPKPKRKYKKRAAKKPAAKKTKK